MLLPQAQPQTRVLATAATPTRATRTILNKLRSNKHRAQQPDDQPPTEDRDQAAARDQHQHQQPQLKRQLYSKTTDQIRAMRRMKPALAPKQTRITATITMETKTDRAARKTEDQTRDKIKRTSAMKHQLARQAQQPAPPRPQLPPPLKHQQPQQPRRQLQVN